MSNINQTFTDRLY